MTKISNTLLAIDTKSKSWSDIQYSPLSATSAILKSPIIMIEKKIQPGSIKGSVFNLLVAIIGAGSLSLPMAMNMGGLGFGVLMILVFGVLAFFSLHMLVISCTVIGDADWSYKSIATRVGGHKFSAFVQGLLMLNLYGTTISYIIASGFMISKVMEVLLPQNIIINHNNNIYNPDNFNHTHGHNHNHNHTHGHNQYHPSNHENINNWITLMQNQQFWQIFITLLFSFPLGLKRSMSSLRFSSLFAVSCLIYLAIVIIIKYFQFCTNGDISTNNREPLKCFWKPEIYNNKIIWFTTNVNQIVTMIPIICYAYTCHPNVLPLYRELQRPSTRRMYKVMFRAILFAVVLYIVISTFGYFTFFEQLEYSNGNFLLNDYHHAPTILIGAIGVSVSVTLAIPLFAHAWRKNFFDLLNDYYDIMSPCPYSRPGAAQASNTNIATIENDMLTNKLLDNVNNNENKDASNSLILTNQVPFRWHFIITTLFFMCALFPALFISDISTVFGILGSTTNPVICFVLPTLFFIKVVPKRKYEKIFAIVTTLLIIIISMYSLIIRKYN